MLLNQQKDNKMKKTILTGALGLTLSSLALAGTNAVSRIPKPVTIRKGETIEEFQKRYPTARIRRDKDGNVINSKPGNARIIVKKSISNSFTRVSVKLGDDGKWKPATITHYQGSNSTYRLKQPTQ